MIDLNKIMDEIDDKREIIAKAIALAFSDGDLTKAKSVYPTFLTYVNGTKLGVIKTNNCEKTAYERENDKLLDKMGKMLGFDAQLMFHNEDYKYACDPLKADNIEGLSEKLEKKLNKSYMSGVKVFIKLGISYDRFIDFYKIHGEEAFRLASIAKILQRRLIFFEYKKIFSLEKEKYYVKEFVNQFGDVVDDYSLKSIDDLMNLYTEICSFFLDESSLSEEEKKIVEENKNSLYKRIGKSFVIIEDLEYLKKRIEMLYENYSMNKCLRESNLDDIMHRNGLKMDKNLFKNFISYYGYVHNVDGFNTSLRIDGEYVNFTFINDRVFNSYSNKGQDLIIVHEFIHSIEPIIDVKPFNEECKYLNEALTEYFAKEALKYLKTNIVNDIVSCKEGVEYISIYDCMIPLVESLKNSSLWWDIVRCKKVNDYSLLIERAGGHASKISKLFEEVYYKNQKGKLDYKTILIYKNKMIELIKEIESQYSRYSKKSPI